MTTRELEKLAQAAIALEDTAMIANPQTIIQMVELLREMGECLEYEVEILGFDAACARDALKKYREMTK